MIRATLLIGFFLFFVNTQNAYCQENPKEPIDCVNPFIGTINYGATNPGAVCPMGMVSVVPFNVTKTEGNKYNMDEGWCSTPYWHDNNVITGFGHVNFSSVGCPDLGSILIMPTTGELNVDHNTYGSTYSDEIASPGYYHTYLKMHRVSAEMTATIRSGLSSYTFPAGESHILLNLGLGLTNETGAYIKKVSDTEIEGFKMLGTFCYNPQDVFPVFFVVRISKKPESMKYWKYLQPLKGDKANWCSSSGTYKIYEKYRKELAGENIGVAFNFYTQNNEIIQVQVGISYVSIENARMNLDEEQHGFNFGKVHENARQAWSQYLNTIRVEGGTDEQKEMFYTAFYHTLLHPNILNDINGDYPLMESEKIHYSKSLSVSEQIDLDTLSSKDNPEIRYTMFSLWDTYRNFHPMKSLIFPDMQLNMVKSILNMYKESGTLPKWEFASQEFNVMEGDPALVVISDTYMRGLTAFDTNLAWEAMYHNAFSPGSENAIRQDNDFYLKNHYIPITKAYDNSVSQAIEYYAADYAFAQFAKATGKNTSYEILMDRSKGYKKYFDHNYGLLRPVTPDGTYFEPFDPKMGENFAPSHGFHEGTSWNYSFAIPHDIPGLINLLGGNAAFVDKLETCFRDSLFDMSNEPDMGYPWYFNFVKDEEWRTQKYVSYCIKNWFSTEPDGLPGNDDAGTLSTWLMCAMMGIYPITPGNPIYTITTPVFRKITIKLNTDYYPAGELIIETDKDPAKYPYLKESEYFISHKKLVSKGSLKLKLKK